MNRRRKILIGVTTVALGVTAFAVGTGVSGAATNGMTQRCVTLNRQMRQTLDQLGEKHTGARGQAVLKHEVQILELVAQERREAGCKGGAGARSGASAAPTMSGTSAAATTAPTMMATTAAPTMAATTTAPAGTVADQVCKGDTVTLSGATGTADSATSGDFPVGTKLKVTNLDNNLSITVTIIGPSGSCVLLDDTAFNTIHEPNKELIRNALIEKVS